MKRMPGIKDVAKASGLSVGTVSNVLNHPEIVSASAKERVEKAIAELGFVPSDTGRSLRAGRSRLVGVIVFNIANPFFSQAARAIENRLAKDGYYPMISSSDGDPKKEKELIGQLTSQRVHGVILVPSKDALSNIELLTRRKIPLVLMDHPPLSEQISSVAVDDETGAAEAIQHLVSLGHKNIGFINGPKDFSQARTRQQGVKQACANLGNSIKVTEINAGSFDSTDGGEALKQLLLNHPETTAVFCASDQLALGAMREVRKLGLAIPGEMSIVGFDDIPAAAELVTPLTTIQQPMDDLGCSAAELLLEQKEPHHISFAPKLVVRDSTGAPRQTTLSLTNAE
ncbi:MAG: LacI family DNA-binding transcriptional regulator [Actinomycetaceae bacterium]|nr:LacI family DNA-binding transcriptional regulator [Actinomycetaceae bacterium]